MMANSESVSPRYSLLCSNLNKGATPAAHINKAFNRCSFVWYQIPAHCTDVRKFTVSGILLLLIIYESFVMSELPCRIVAFCDPLAVRIFPGDILYLL
jgi:hypothetical protein